MEIWEAKNIPQVTKNEYIISEILFLKKLNYYASLEIDNATGDYPLTCAIVKYEYLVLQKDSRFIFLDISRAYTVNKGNTTGIALRCINSSFKCAFIVFDGFWELFRNPCIYIWSHFPSRIEELYL